MFRMRWSPGVCTTTVYRHKLMLVLVALSQREESSTDSAFIQIVHSSADGVVPGSYAQTVLCCLQDEAHIGQLKCWLLRFALSLCFGYLKKQVCASTWHSTSWPVQCSVIAKTNLWVPSCGQACPPHESGELSPIDASKISRTPQLFFVLFWHIWYR
jgi:hypothetical protein